MTPETNSPLRMIEYAYCSRQRTKSFSTTHAYNSSNLALTSHVTLTRRVISRWRTRTIFRFRDPSRRGKWEERKSNSLTETTVVLCAESSGLGLEKEGGLNLSQNSSSMENVQFLYISKNCTKDILCKRNSFSSSENQQFSSCTKWRSDFLSVFLVFSLFHLCQKCFIWHVNMSWTSAKRWWEAPDLHLNSLWISTHLWFLQIKTWSMTKQISSRPGLDSMSLGCKAEMLTTRPPSPWFQWLLLVYIDFTPNFRSFFSLWHNSACLENVISHSPVLDVLNWKPIFL